MQPAPVLSAVLTSALLLVPSLASTQTIEQVMAGAPGTGERFGIGMLGGLGYPGPLFGVRASIPASPKVGFDLDVAFNPDVGRMVTGQLRYLWKGRNVDGVSPHWIIGAVYFQSTSRSEIRWPDGTRTVTETPHSNVAGQFGIGFDAVTDRGGRVGVQFTTGVAPRAGPVIYAKLFVLFGKAKR
jgi:hypothetical protein